MEGSSPLQNLEVLGEVGDRHEGVHMRGEAREGLVVEDLDGGLFDHAVHALDLTVRPEMIGLGEPVLNVMLTAHTVKGTASDPSRRSFARAMQRSKVAPISMVVVPDEVPRRRILRFD